MQAGSLGPPRSRALPCFAPSQKVFSFLPSSLLWLCSDLKKISGITQPMHSTLWTPNLGMAGATSGAGKWVWGSIPYPVLALLDAH